jgi:putative ABC transport system ATP-binding protein
METLIISENITKSFAMGTEKQNVLNEISVEIRQGEFVAVMGPSGSGKSTLLYALSGMDSVDSGKICFDGVELSALKENELADLRRAKMGFVFQQPTLLKNLNILDNIILPTMRDGRKKKAQLTEKAKMLMIKTGIAGLETRDITQVSGGQLQRVGICRALMGDPKIIFGDEPTGALNSSSANEIMTLLSQIHGSGVTILLVTHDIKVAAKAGRVLFIYDGKIAGEYLPGGYNETGDNQKAREERLTTWLAGMKF